MTVFQLPLIVQATSQREKSNEDTALANRRAPHDYDNLASIDAHLPLTELHFRKLSYFDNPREEKSKVCNANG